MTPYGYILARRRRSFTDIAPGFAMGPGSDANASVRDDIDFGRAGCAPDAYFPT